MASIHVTKILNFQNCEQVLLTSNMGHLFVVGEFVVVSHRQIFPLQLLGSAAGRAELGVPGVPRYPHLLGVLQNKNLKKNGNFAKKVFQYLPYLLGYPHLKFASALSVAHQAVLISYHDYAILEYSGELISRNIAILMTKGKRERLISDKMFLQF